MERHLLLSFIIASSISLRSIKADTPANCTYDDIIGVWTFYEGSRGLNYSLNCNNFPEIDGGIQHKFRVELLFPSVAVDEHGNLGRWTLIYNQGFEVHINYRKYFAFSNWIEREHLVTSRCFETKPGWSHDIFVRDWSCYVGKRAPDNSVGSIEVKKHRKYLEESLLRRNAQMTRKNNLKLADTVNYAQKSWKAKAYKQFEGLTKDEMIKMAGGTKSVILNRPKPAPKTPEQVYQARDLPLSFDWRNVKGVSFVSPVRSQGKCGSCYAFASAGMLEARYRVRTNNTMQPVFSPQDIVECSQYSQGCEGGFPFLIAGKYAQDFGVVDEACNPYKGAGKHSCSSKPTCRRYYTADYNYVGGYYGASNEALMRLELVNNGPLAVGFEVYEDFFLYKEGIYRHSKNLLNGGLKWNPFELTNHAVLLVGYGVDDTTNEHYWIVKNSWGPEWGENGYFRIRRGTDECGIESIAVAATPIITY